MSFEAMFSLTVRLDPSQDSRDCCERFWSQLSSSSFNQEIDCVHFPLSLNMFSMAFEVFHSFSEFFE